MEHRVKLSHVAFLVRSVAEAEKVTRHLGFPSCPTEEWEGEGTLEIYVGDPSKAGRLLLMEAVRDGAYRRAFQKRGPGLHHVAVDVLDLEEYIHGLSGTGWLLRPRSLKTMKATQTAYLARPGVPTLIEVQRREKISSDPLFTERLEIPVSAAHLSHFDKMLTALGVPELRASTDEKSWLTCDGKRFATDVCLL